MPSLFGGIGIKLYATKQNLLSTYQVPHTVIPLLKAHSSEISVIIDSILQICKLQHRKVKWVA